MSEAVVEPHKLVASLSEEETFWDGSETLPDDSTIDSGQANAPTVWFTDCLTRLRDFALLRNNWDGQGSLPPKVEALYGAKDFLFELVENHIPRPHITPADDGAITFEWTGIDISLTIDIYSSTNAVMHYIVFSTLEQWEGHPAEAPTNLDKLFRQLSEDRS